MSLVTVCIPTYKRRALLQGLLTTLLPQAEELGVRVRVIENHCEDGTLEYLTMIQRRFPCLGFERNSTTLPIDENMSVAMQSAESRYVYPLGDDDFLPRGALAKIVGQLSKGPDLLILSAVISDSQLNPRGFVLPANLRGVSFDDPSKAFPQLWNRMPFGSFVVRRDLLGSRYFEKYFGTSHAYSGAVWDMLATNFTERGKVLIDCMDTPTVFLRQGAKTWRPEEARILLVDVPLWFTLLEKRYTEFSLPLRDQSIAERSSTLALCGLRKSGQLTRRNVRQLTRFLNPRQTRRALLISYLPRVVAGILRFWLRNVPKLARVTSRLRAGRRAA
jgi:glycosyltransferase involved in cell wall biosynthesis